MLLKINGKIRTKTMEIFGNLDLLQWQRTYRIENLYCVEACKEGRQCDPRTVIG